MAELKTITYNLEIKGLKELQVLTKRADQLTTELHKVLGKIDKQKVLLNIESKIDA